MITSLNNAAIKRCLKPSGEFVLGKYFCQIPVRVATIIGKGGMTKELKAGNTYLLKLAGTVKPEKMLFHVLPNPILFRHGTVSVQQFLTPEDSEGVDLDIIFTCVRDLSLESVKYGIRIISDCNIYHSWE